MLLLERITDWQFVFRIVPHFNECLIHFEMETTHRTSTASGTNKLTVPFYAPPPFVKKTSAEIISEARASIIHDKEGIRIENTRMAASIRPVKTKRPFTPRERQRTLFGTAQKSSCRPPSSFSLGYLQFQDADLGSSLSATPHIRRLNPIPATPSASLSTSSSLLDLRDWKTLLNATTSEGSRSRVLSAQPLEIPLFLTSGQITSAAKRFRLPSIDGGGKPSLSQRHQFRATASLDNLPEEIEVDDNESQDSGINSSSIKEAPPARKAYSCPMQRTTELDKCTVKKKLQSASERKMLQEQSSSITENNSGTKKDAAESVIVVQSKTNEEIANNGVNSVKVVMKNPKGRNIINNELLEVKQKMQEEIFQKDSSHSVRDKKEICLESTHKNSFKTKTLQLDANLATCEENTLGTVKEPTSKNRNSYPPDKSKKNDSTADKELSSQDQQLEENVFGPELKTKTSNNNAKFSNKSENNFQGQKDKSVNLNAKECTITNSAKKYSKQVSKNSIITIQRSATGNPVVGDNRLSVSKNEISVKNGTEPKFFDETIAQNPSSKDNFSTADSTTEMKERQSFYQAKEVNETADKCIDIREKSVVTVSEEKNNFIQSILTALNSLAGKEENIEEVVSLMLKLYSALETEGEIGKKFRNTKLRAQVLKTLYKFLESSNDMLLLQIARIILAFRVNGKNLSGVCKLVFKVSRSDKNDKLFLEDNILELFMEVLGLASPLEDAESCVYGYGALKFLTMNTVILAKVLKLGILELMVLHMKIVNAARAEGSHIPEQTSHALFQLTGALRNVAGEEEMFPKFVSTGAVNELCKAMDFFSSDLDVISNISRTLSIISTHDDCCMSIVDYKNSFKVFVQLLQKYPGRQDIIVRLGYVLGNLMASSDVARTKFFNEDGAVASMLNLLAIYMDKDHKMLGSTNHHSEFNSDAGSNGSVEDVIIKLIRILANMCINPEVGSSLACSPTVFYSCNGHQREMNTNHISIGNTGDDNRDGRQFLDILLTVLRRKSVIESEELVHSILSTLNNLSYYPASNDGAFGERQLEIAQALSSLLNTDNKDCLVEATRVFGNLTRSKDTRDFLLESGAWNQLLKFLNWDDQELLCTTIGILVNMMADWDKRIALKEGHGIERLTSVLNKFGEGDWQLATLICQTLWNYCTESTNLHAALGIDETNHLLAILVDFLDEERLFGVVEGTEVNEALAASGHYQMWEEFAGVATNLLEKMEIFLDSLDSLESLEHMEPLLISDHQALGQQISFTHPDTQIHIL
ncbi:armadillo repeat-containing protein 2 isoform X2 [Zootermopsis nevadensis]|uniref:armadillo repeat-containing protein 2 isoform X2 n=1 Tax=Zootermopsis nevadensis TaxID=136037 RepID=UPI000B8E90CA|nr:armadillo repeat-containing protein 2 isoform X2 [Zootermopsis nevadensis]